MSITKGVCLKTAEHRRTPLKRPQDTPKE